MKKRTVVSRFRGSTRAINGTLALGLIMLGVGAGGFIILGGLVAPNIAITNASEALALGAGILVLGFVGFIGFITTIAGAFKSSGEKGVPMHRAPPPSQSPGSSHKTTGETHIGHGGGYYVRSRDIWGNRRDPPT